MSTVRISSTFTTRTTLMGAGQVTLGSDYPFDMGVEDPVDRLEAAGFGAATTDAIRGGNAARLLGLEQ